VRSPRLNEDFTVTLGLHAPYCAHFQGGLQTGDFLAY
jgi:hypothetical protein